MEQAPHLITIDEAYWYLMGIIGVVSAVLALYVVGVYAGAVPGPVEIVETQPDRSQTGVALLLAGIPSTLRSLDR